MRNAIPLALLIGGSLAVMAYAYLWIFANDARPVQFAVACLVAVIGWSEMRATESHESHESSGF